MSLKSQIARLKKLAAAQEDTPAAHALQRTRLRDAREQWKRAFIEGGTDRAGPVPLGPHATAAERAWEEMTLRGDACVIARLERRVGPLAYLPGLTAADRACCDWSCGLFYRIERSLAVRAGEDPDAAVADYPPEWATLDGPQFQTLERLRGHYAEEEDLTKLTDAELDERLAAVKARLAAGERPSGPR